MDQSVTHWYRYGYLHMKRNIFYTPDLSHNKFEKNIAVRALDSRGVEKSCMATDTGPNGSCIK